MTTVLTINIVLSAIVFTAVVGLISWGIRTQARQSIAVVTDHRRRVTPHPARAAQTESERHLAGRRRGYSDPGFALDS